MYPEDAVFIVENWLRILQTRMCKWQCDTARHCVGCCMQRTGSSTLSNGSGFTVHVNHVVDAMYHTVCQLHLLSDDCLLHMNCGLNLRLWSIRVCPHAEPYSHACL